jgi:tetratricopeptide (TPR) repeat protein
MSGPSGILGLVLRVAVIASLLMAWVQFAGADDEDRLRRARAHYEAGRALYTLGRYDDALREFLSGHQLTPRPRFLLNMGQCYRMLEQPEKARAMFLAYLDDPSSFSDEAERKKVEELLQEATRAAAARPPPNTAAPQPPAPQAVAQPVQTQAPVPIVSHAPAKASGRRLLWLVPLAGVVVVGVALGVGLGLGLAPDCPAAGGLGCIDGRPAR